MDKINRKVVGYSKLIYKPDKNEKLTYSGPFCKVYDEETDV